MYLIQPNVKIRGNLSMQILVYTVYLNVVLRA